MLRLQLGLKNSSYPNFYCAWGMQRIPKEELKSKPLFRFPYASNATTTTTKRCSRVVGTVLCPFLFLVIESIERMHFLTLWWRFFVPKHFVFTFLLFFSSGDHCYCILGRRKSGNCVSPYTWQLHPPWWQRLGHEKISQGEVRRMCKAFLALSDGLRSSSSTST